MPSTSPAKRSTADRPKGGPVEASRHLADPNADSLVELGPEAILELAEQHAQILAARHLASAELIAASVMRFVEAGLVDRNGQTKAAVRLVVYIAEQPLACRK